MPIRVGKDGIFRVESNDFYDATARVRPISALPTITEKVVLKIPRIPYDQLEKILDQMRYVAMHQDSELYIAVYYSHEEREYRFVIPEQTPTMANQRVKHGPLPPSPRGFNLIGDIHSHKDGPAGHSHWDDDDEFESGMGGIHVTFGNLLTSIFPSVSCSVVVDDQRVVFPAEDLFEPPPAKETVEIEALSSLKIPVTSKACRVLHSLAAVFRVPNPSRGGDKTQ
jgi:hypothetical protein